MVKFVSFLLNYPKLVSLFLILIVYIAYAHRKKSEFRKNALQSLHNKVVVITGASSGLGSSLAQIFHAYNCRVILCSRNTEKLHSIKKNLDSIVNQKTSGKRVAVVKLDLTDYDSISKSADEILNGFGSVDILVCNAGVSQRGSVTETSPNTVKTILYTNYLGHSSLINHILPTMQAQRNGHIVAIGSVQSLIAIPYRSAYSASKHALKAFCDSLRAEVHGDGIQVLVVNPGYINTNLSVNSFCADGNPYGRTDATTKCGFSSEFVALTILNSVVSKDKEILIADIKSRGAVYIRNWFPSLFHWLMEMRAENYVLEKKT